jgi:hypothetical protein
MQTHIHKRSQLDDEEDLNSKQYHHRKQTNMRTVIDPQRIRLEKQNANLQEKNQLKPKINVLSVDNNVDTTGITSEPSIIPPPWKTERVRTQRPIVL